MLELGTGHLDFHFFLEIIFLSNRLPIGGAIMFRFGLPVYKFCFLISIFFSALPGYTQESNANLGIFNATADWGTAESPPQKGDFKVPGSVTICDSTKGTVYNIFANGDGIWGTNDEGFFLYGEKTGSWSLMGKFELPECSQHSIGVKQVSRLQHNNTGEDACSTQSFNTGEDVCSTQRINTGEDACSTQSLVKNNQAQVGIMIREKGDSANSKCYTIQYRRTENNSFSIEVRVRRKEGGPTYRLYYDYIPRKQDGFYLRVSRFAASDIFLAEWSLDGIYWNAVHKENLAMEDSIAYGLCATNQKDNDLLVHARFSEVEFCPASPMAERTFSAVDYESNIPIQVTLNIQNPNDRSESLQLSEWIPIGWTVDNISHNGALKNNSIEWDSQIESGNTEVTYHLIPPSDASRVVPISGCANNRNVIGDNYLRPKIEETADIAKGEWRYWTNSDGLADSWCLSPVINSSGTVWISHINKVSCMDGYEISAYPNPDTWFPVIDHRSGHVWTVYGENLVQKVDGFQRLEGNEWIRYPVENINAGMYISFFPIAKNQILCLSPDRLMLYDTENKSLAILKNVDNTDLTRFLELITAKNGSFWITTQKGIVKVDISLNNLPSLSVWEEYLLPQDCRLSYYSSPFEDDYGRLFMMGVDISQKPNKAILLRFSGKCWELLHFADDHNMFGIPTGNDSFIMIEGPGALYDRIGNSTLSLIENGRKAFINKGKVLSGNIHGTAVDRNGVIWISSAHGLARYAPSIWSTPPPVSHIEKICCSIYEDDQDCLWFGCQDELVKYADGKWSFYPMPAGSRFYPYSANSFCSSPDGKLVITGCGGSMVIFDAAAETFEVKRHPEGRMLESMFPRKYGGVWLFTRGSYNTSDYYLEIYNWKDFTVHYEIGKEAGAREICDLYEDSNGRLWLGGNWTGKFGVGIYKEGVFQSFDAECPDKCNSICATDESTLWFNSGNRIVAYDGNQWRTVHSGFDKVLKIMKDRKNSIWVSSYDGLYRFHEDCFSLMTQAEGLPDAVIYTAFEDSQGRIWAGTSQGISLYNPNADMDPPQTYISKDLNVQQVSSAGNNQIVFSGIDKWKYTVKDRLLYSYRIDSNEWSTFDEKTTAFLSELSPGTHQFEVRAMDRNWNIDPTPARFEFYVMPPWYQQWGFIIGTLITLSALGYAISRHINLEHLVTDRTSQLRSLASEISLTEQRERRQIATDLHDRIGHGLATCQMQIEILQNKSINGEDTSSTLRKTRDIIKQTIQDARTLTVEISPPALYEFGLVPAVKWLIDQMNEQYQMNFQFQENGTPHEIGEDERGILYRAIRECLFNIVKHAKTKEAFVSVTYRNQHVHIKVEDYGEGFDLNQLQSNRMKKQSFGLFAIQERIQYIGGKFECHSRLGEGTRIDLKLPLRKDSTIRNGITS